MWQVHYDDDDSRKSKNIVNSEFSGTDLLTDICFFSRSCVQIFDLNRIVVDKI